MALDKKAFVEAARKSNLRVSRLAFRAAGRVFLPAAAAVGAIEIGRAGYHGAKAAKAGYEYGRLKKKVKARIQKGYKPQVAPKGK